MKRNINRYVKEVLFEGKPLPPSSSRRFFPLQKDLANHILNEVNTLKHSKIDQENLEHLFEKWKQERPEDSFFFRGYTQGKKQQESKERMWYDENGTRIVSATKIDILQFTKIKFKSLKFGSDLEFLLE